MDDENSLLEHTCKLNFTEPASHYRLTGVIGTVSKASRSLQVLRKMIRTGMTIVRLNFSHETHELHAETIRLLHNVEEEYSKEMGYTIQLAIALDTKGPEIRTGLLEAGPNSQVELKVNDSVRLSINRDLMDKGNRECIFVDYENIINVVQPGNFVYINDGSLKFIVKEVGVDCVTCQVERGGMLGSRKKINLPGVSVDLPAVSKKDVNDLKFALEHKIDFIFASSMRNASAVKEVRSLLGDQGKYVKIIAKIDCEQGLHNVDEIISVADGILFASADIAIEINNAKVFLAQKAVMARCNRAGKPVIVATKLLESMRYSIFPTKAEFSDLGNAILDGADCVMLSSETAIGQFPSESIAYMCDICREAELALWNRHMFEDLLLRNPTSLDAAHSMAIAAVDAAKKSSACAIVVLTASGKSSYLLAKYRPGCPILAVTKCPRTFRQSHLYRGVIPVMYTEITQKRWLNEVDARVQFCMNVANRMNIIKSGDSVVILSPWKNDGGFTNTMRLVYAFFEQEDIDGMCKTDRKSTKKLKV
ncbi:pyruvate kinase-like isoform X1 [Lucilia sericata]|uniref:pyruvate kinase-like isoform X1 n=1 Tax=Lucilia sericata TaxID=13632 RepID=UPI0018A8794B|nr:pyruvate kinase-like isoform X1 [Lucilia sericata]